MNKVVLVGRLTRDPEVRYSQDGVKVYTTEVIVEEQEFAESRAESDANRANFQHQAAPAPSADAGDGFMNIPEGIDDVLPFN